MAASLNERQFGPAAAAIGHAVLAGLLASVVLAGCTAGAASPFVIEEISPQEQVLEAVRSAPTDFTVPFENDGPAWKRALVFFELYLGEQPQVAADGSSATNRGVTNGRYLYLIQRGYSGDGVIYKVSCESRSGAPADAARATQNARNLARFIRDRVLELSVLNR